MRKKNSFIADMEKILSVSIEGQTSLNIPSSENLIQSKDLTVFNFMNPERGEKPSEKKYEVSRSWFMKFKERKSSLHNITVYTHYSEKKRDLF